MLKLLRRSVVFLVVILLSPQLFAAAPETKPDGNIDRLTARYTGMLNALRTELAQAVPKVDDRKLSKLQAATAAVKKARTDVDAAKKPLEKLATAEALVAHAKGKWLGGAEKGIVAAQAALKKATTDAQRAEANKQLAHWQADQAAGLKALAEREAARDAAKSEQAQAIAAGKAASAALVAAEAEKLQAAGAVLAEVDPFLSQDQWDAKLAKCAVISLATPKGLAEFARQGSDQEKLVEQLLADPALLRDMLEADGANGNKYGEAMRIYTEILKTSKHAGKGVFKRLALGTALEHAVPIEQRNSESDQNAPSVIDPVKRYLHYETAYLNNELDPAFKDMSVWEYRLIVDSNAPDHVLAWGREMLRNYRPDHILNSDYGWRYSGIVRTDVAYRSSHLLKDDDSLEFFQNVCKEGGICGRRAFFGRFIVQAFGLPCVARPQTGHASIGRWTPNGWVINLGAGWGQGKGVNGRTDLDFILETQVRKLPSKHLQALRAQWVGDALGEEKYSGFKEGSGGLWNRLAVLLKHEIVAEAKPAQLAALGAELGEANESAAVKAAAVAKAKITEADKKIVATSGGGITIPASACQGSLQSVNSFLGGAQAICGGPFSCEIEVPKAGKYALTARVVTVHENIGVTLADGNAKNPIEIAVPYTVGKWQSTAPVEVTLTQGKNKLNFTKTTGRFTLKELTLTPVK